MNPEAYDLGNLFSVLQAVLAMAEGYKHVTSVELSRIADQKTLAGTIVKGGRAVVITFDDVNTEGMPFFKELSETFSRENGFSTLFGDGDTVLLIMNGSEAAS